jgi:hypothetical protein
MNETQVTICHIILAMISMDTFRENINTTGFRYIFGQTIRQYAEINNNYQKTWKKIELCRVHHQFTVRAGNLLNANPDVNNDTIWQLLHYEHIVPISCIIQQLIDLHPNNLNFENISTIMQQNEVIIMTKEEAKVLDGRVDGQYLLGGEYVNGQGMRANGTREQRLSSINTSIHNDYINNSINAG